jgi:hypothetical protein
MRVLNTDQSTRQVNQQEAIMAGLGALPDMQRTFQGAGGMGPTSPPAPPPVSESSGGFGNVLAGIGPALRSGNTSAFVDAAQGANQDLMSRIEDGDMSTKSPFVNDVLQIPGHVMGGVLGLGGAAANFTDQAAAGVSDYLFGERAREDADPVLGLGPAGPELDAAVRGFGGGSESEEAVSPLAPSAPASTRSSDAADVEEQLTPGSTREEILELFNREGDVDMSRLVELTERLAPDELTDEDRNEIRRAGVFAALGQAAARIGEDTSTGQMLLQLGLAAASGRGQGEEDIRDAEREQRQSQREYVAAQMDVEGLRMRREDAQRAENRDEARFRQELVQGDEDRRYARERDEVSDTLNLRQLAQREEELLLRRQEIEAARGREMAALQAQGGGDAVAMEYGHGATRRYVATQVGNSLRGFQERTQDEPTAAEYGQIISPFVASYTGMTAGLSAAEANAVLPPIVLERAIAGQQEQMQQAAAQGVRVDDAMAQQIAVQSRQQAIDEWLAAPERTEEEITRWITAVQEALSRE